LNSDEYRRAEARLEEALAIFVERQAQFSTLVDSVQENLTRIRADVAHMRAEREKSDARARLSRQ
jgi:hypothetical protein